MTYTETMAWLPIQLIAIACWSAVNVLDSLLIAHFHKRPLTILWHQTLWSIPVLVIGILWMGEWSSWSSWLIIAGIFSFVADVLFFRALDRMDVSVVQIAWAIMAVLLSLGAIVLFGESWTTMQSLGVILLLLGVCVLSLWGRALRGSHLLQLFLIALFNLPFYLTQKAALLDGVTVLQSVLWSLIGREGISLIANLVIPSWRKNVLAVFGQMRWHFFAINAAVILFFFWGVTLNTIAYDLGPLSLAVVVSNIQPFFTMFLAWLCYTFTPEKAAKELFTAQAVRVKIISFLIVFAGLALLTFSA